MSERALARESWRGENGHPQAADGGEQPRREPAGSGRQRPLLLIADDERPVLQMLERLGDRIGYDIVTCEGGQDALRAMRERTPDLALVDLRMPDLGGMDVLRQLRLEAPACQVAIMTAYGAIDSAVEAMKLGAREYITKPFDFAQLRGLLTEVRDEILQPPRVSSESVPDLCAMLGNTPVMQDVSELVRSLGSSAKVVLISGERGCGKELVARAFHQCSPRASRPFVTINCSALVDSLFERKLFGHEQGAFTGADEAAPGLFEAAQGGTIFLDDVGDLPLAVQGSVAQTLETGEIQRVGGRRSRPIDVAIVAATQRDLRADVASGRFRADLFYRLSMVGIVLPPLRERRDDIHILAMGFLRESAASLGKLLTGFSDDALQVLRDAPWEGNVRELRATVERACRRASGQVVSVEDVAASAQDVAGGPRSGGLHVVRTGTAGRAPLQDVEREHILSVLHDVRGNRVAAAKVLGISRRALYRRLARHQISESLRAVPPPAPDDDPQA